MEMLAVRARGLTKLYGSLAAVAGIDLDVKKGRCFGLLGPNGAGKTTTISMITCVSPPSGGRLEVLGMDVEGDRRAIKHRLGVVPQGMTLDTALRVKENLMAHAAYFGIRRVEAGRLADELLEFTHLSDRANSGIFELSGGMQRRLLIARALVSDPELVVLDEPTTGLDPQARHLVWERLRLLKRQGKTLLITTHYMEEAAHLCDRLAVLDHGRIVAEGPPSDLVRKYVPPRVVEVHHADGTIDSIRTALAGAASDVEEIGDRVLAYGDDGEEIVHRIRQAGFEHHTLLLRETTLEDVFLRLTGHGLTD